MAIAVAGLTTESMGAAITGMSNVKASIVQLTLTSCGSRVRRLGTIAMSSNAYARFARLARPISMSLTHDRLPSAGYTPLVPDRLVGLVDAAVLAEDQEPVERAREPPVVRHGQNRALESVQGIL